MKKFFFLTLALLLFAIPLFGLPVNNDQPVSAGTIYNNKIEVIGVGEVSKLPDMAIVSVGVDTKHEILTEAEKENTEKVNSIISTLLNKGILKENIKTTDYTVYQRYDYQNGEKFLGYQLSNHIDFKTKDLDGLSDLLASLMESGANSFHGIRFCIEDYQSAYNEALSSAIENARSKATVLSGGSGSLMIVKVKEKASYSPIYYNNFSLAKAAEVSSGISRGEVCVKAEVEVNFIYQ